jgi:hypothetical protein
MVGHDDIPERISISVIKSPKALLQIKKETAPNNVQTKKKQKKNENVKFQLDFLFLHHCSRGKRCGRYKFGMVSHFVSSLWCVANAVWYIKS